MRQSPTDQPIEVHLTVSDGLEAITFREQAFGASDAGATIPVAATGAFPGMRHGRSRGLPGRARPTGAALPETAGANS